MSIPSVLGSRGVRYFNAFALPAGVATWSCYYGSPSATQSSGTLQPSVGTLGSGVTYPIFSASVSTYNLLSCASAMSFTLSYASTNSYVYGYLEQIVSVPNAIGVWIDINSSGGIADGCMAFSNGNGPMQLYANGTTDAFTTSGQDDNVQRRIITHYNGSTGVTTIYVNNVAQAQTGNGQIGLAWKTAAMSFGTQPSVTSRCVQGSIAGFFCGADSSPFSGTDISNLDTELLNLTYNATVQNSSSGPSVARRSCWFDEETGYPSS